MGRRKENRRKANYGHPGGEDMERRTGPNEFLKNDPRYGRTDVM